MKEHHRALLLLPHIYCPAKAFQFSIAAYRTPYMHVDGHLQLE